MRFAAFDTMFMYLAFLGQEIFGMATRRASGEPSACRCVNIEGISYFVLCYLNVFVSFEAEDLLDTVFWHRRLTCETRAEIGSSNHLYWAEILVEQHVIF